MELSTEQADKMVSKDTNEASSVKSKRKPQHPSRQRKQYGAPSGSKETERKRTEKCRNCGGNFLHKTGLCPAKGKTCNYCQKQNHFVVVCMKKKRKEQGSVIQTIVSLTSSLRRQLVKYMLTTSSNPLLFFCWKNVRIFCTAKDSHIFSNKK